MKLAIRFKEDESQLDFILHSLKIRNFEISSSSNKWTYWIYNLKNVQFFENYIQIERKEPEFIKIYLNNIEYFEIDKED